MYIYDRWGRQVFATKDLGNGWDGIIDGNQLVGVYTYVSVTAIRQGGEEGTGMVTLVR
ncbi:MAG: gliding motility-associated C-terminal domain-containing protein [Bacteroidales bacterium]|nr:gliding motility-associated C-terminal domain-containing protein [Bacteroidales bacterium]